VPVSINRGVPIALANPRAGVVKSLGEIADKLVPVRTPAGDEKKKSKRLGR
jgi:MinD-like ATPase involved in chromosome partitioning or flagellar assembly